MADDNSVQIDKLSLDIQVKAGKSAEKINSVSQAIDNLTKSLSGLEKVNKQMQQLQTMFDSLNKSLRATSKKSSTKNGVTGNVLKTAELNISKPSNNLKSITKGSLVNLEGISSATEDIVNNTEKATSSFNKFIKSIGRIALYRAVRSLLKSISQSMQEGFRNFVQFDNASNQAMSNVTNSFNQLQNTLGVMAGYLVQTLEPVLTTLSNLTVSLFENLNMALASASGKGTYTKAIKQNKDYADSIKQINSALLSFDTFNTLATSNEDKKLFEDVEIPNEMPKMAQYFEQFIELINEMKKVIKEVFETIKPLFKPLGDLIISTGNLAINIIKAIQPALKPLSQILQFIIEQVTAGVKVLTGFIKLLTFDFSGGWKDLSSGYSSGFKSLGKGLWSVLSPSIKTKSLGSFATGGSFNTGDYFVANENGNTELVASTNSGGAVMNMEQLQSAIYSGMIMAMADSGGGEIVLKVNQDTLGRVVANNKVFTSEINRKNKNINLL